MFPIPWSFVPIPLSSFGGGAGGGVAGRGENPMDMTSFRFRALMPGTTMLIAEYEGCAMIGGDLKVGLDGVAVLWDGCVGLIPLCSFKGVTSNRVSPTVGTVFVAGGWTNVPTALPVESERESLERPGDVEVDSALLERTGPADSLRLLLSDGTSKGGVLPTSETTRSLSSRCLRSATILRISSKPREMLLLGGVPGKSSPVDMLTENVDAAGDDDIECGRLSLTSEMFFFSPAHCTPHFWSVSLAWATALGFDASAAVTAAAVRDLRFPKKVPVDALESPLSVFEAKLKVLGVDVGGVLGWEDVSTD